MIDALYAASQAGVPIDLIVRGICCLRPGVPGLSETIRVRSIVGEFLEHSRIYRFGADPVEAEYLIGSADLMPRNLDRRVEAVVPVDDLRLRARLAEVLDVALADDVLAWELVADGTWSRDPAAERVDTQRGSGSSPSPARARPEARPCWSASSSSHPGPSFELPDLDDPPGACTPTRPITTKLVAVYYDTADFRLARAGASLRYRNDEGWTVKLPVAQRRRPLPHRAARPRRGRRAARGSARPRAGAGAQRTRAAHRPPQHVRKTVNIRDASGRRRSPKSSTTRCRCSTASAWRHGSASSRSSSPRTPTTRSRPCSGQLLQKAGAGRPDPVPKIVRAIGPARARSARRRTTPQARLRVHRPRSGARPRSPRRSRRLIVNDPGVRLGDDTESVHQARVATRRLRSDLRTFRERRRRGVERADPRRAEMAGANARRGARHRSAARAGSKRASTSSRMPTCDGARRPARHAARASAPRPASGCSSPCAPSATSRCSTASSRRRATSRRRPRPTPSTISSSSGSCAARGGSCGARSTRSTTNRPTRSCTRCGSAAKRAGTRPKRSLPRGHARQAFAKRIADLQDMLGEHQDAVVAERVAARAARAGRRTSCSSPASCAATERAASRTLARQWPAVWRRARRKKLRQWM